MTKTGGTPRLLMIGLDAAEVLPVSAKEGKGIAELLEAVVARAPPPKGDPAAPTRALVFDSWFAPYVGAAMLVRVVDGAVTCRTAGCWWRGGT